MRLSEVPEAEVSQLAEEFGVDRRRIVKDLEILADAGDAVGDGADLRVEAHEDDVRLSLSTRLAGPVRLGPQQTCDCCWAPACWPSCCPTTTPSSASSP
ncbi:hypothetical protein A5N15_10590 [Rothia kristinae]|uniref:PafC HTH domain-containing protein n=1 Tax=Rothia kristinae TaxID=37923 RepID=A0A657ITL7_9MICC|nr:hypothetical protein A5N15_10590 [Rothia kristinae]